MSNNPDLFLAPNARLARHLRNEIARQKITEGKSAWVTARCYSVVEWFRILGEEYFLHAPDHRVLVDSQQTHLMWQSIIDQDVFIGEPRVTSLATRAWRTICESVIETPDKWTDLYLSEDSQRFKQWATSYKAQCKARSFVDEWAFFSEIPKHIAKGFLDIPNNIELVGFDLPQRQLFNEVISAFQKEGTIVTYADKIGNEFSPDSVLECEDQSGEILVAARWAKEKIEENPLGNFAIVVGDLETRMEQIERAVRKVFDPAGFALSETVPQQWHISLGKSLARWQIVADALEFLALSTEKWTQLDIRMVLRSPYLSGWNEESDAQSAVIANGGVQASYFLTFTEVLRALQAEKCDVLGEALADWRECRHSQPKRAWPSDWAKFFQDELRSLGFTLGRKLDSREYQILERWYKLLDEFGRFDALASNPISRVEALRQLSERAEIIMFRERNDGVPLEIMSYQEAIGSTFDAIWLAGLDDTLWPPPVEKDPFIPLSLQTHLELSSAAGCLKYAREALGAVFSSAPVIECSFVRGNGGRIVSLTPLLSHCKITTRSIDRFYEQAQMDAPFLDQNGPAISSKVYGGGMSFLRDQSSCAFKSFAKWRLGAVEIKTARPGLNASQRGVLIHQALEYVWRNLGSKSVLETLTDSDLLLRIREAVEQSFKRMTSKSKLLLIGTSRQIEKDRIEDLLYRWLEYEKLRPDFVVEDQESQVVFKGAGVSFTGKIDRIDRIADGTTMLIDYKTGAANFTDWEPSLRIEDPQMPVYATSMSDKPMAIAYAVLRADLMGFSGLAEESETAGLKTLDQAGSRFNEKTWESLFSEWEAVLKVLSREVAEGVAAVNPRGAKECLHCHLQAFCRVGYEGLEKLGDERNVTD